MADSYQEVVEQARASGEGLVLVAREGAHATVTLNDPERLNPLGAALSVRLRDTLTALAADESVRAVVLTGADPAFSAGGDLRLMRDTAQPMLAGAGGAPELWRWIRMEFGGIARLITRSDKAFVAAVNGAAAGVGLAFALACDLILVSERASGPRLRANAVLPHAELLAAAREWCERIEGLPPHVSAMMKPLLRGAADMTWDQAIAMEEFAEPQCFTTEAHRTAVEGILAAG
jgi:2-(1,2-epoxy-1,2-dihydrophenyl)acetyl-CoA isomerase